MRRWVWIKRNSLVFVCIFGYWSISLMPTPSFHGRMMCIDNLNQPTIEQTVACLGTFFPSARQEDQWYTLNDSFEWQRTNRFFICSRCTSIWMDTKDKPKHKRPHACVFMHWSNDPICISGFSSSLQMSVKENQYFSNLNEQNIATCLKIVNQLDFEQMNLPRSVRDFILDIAAGSHCDPKVLFYAVLPAIGHFCESMNVYNLESKQVKPITVYEIIIAPSGLSQQASESAVTFLI